jgi:hypothetical protein
LNLDRFKIVVLSAAILRRLKENIDGFLPNLMSAVMKSRCERLGFQLRRYVPNVSNGAFEEVE